MCHSPNNAAYHPHSSIPSPEACKLDGASSRMPKTTASERFERFDAATSPLSCPRVARNHTEWFVGGARAFANRSHSRMWSFGLPLTYESHGPPLLSPSLPTLPPSLVATSVIFLLGIRSTAGQHEGPGASLSPTSHTTQLLPFSPGWLASSRAV
jgi:hypothetical protein